MPEILLVPATGDSALEGCRFAKLAGKGTALDELRAQASVRFAGQGRRKVPVAEEAV